MYRNNIILLPLLLSLLLPLSTYSQLKSISIIGGAELSSHRLVSPVQAGPLAFEVGIEFASKSSEREQSTNIGIQADFGVSEQFGVITQLDYGRILYSLSFKDTGENTSIFGPPDRGLFYAANRVDASLLPYYSFSVGKFSINPQIGVSYSIPLGDNPFEEKKSDDPRSDRAVAAQNALHRSFGRSTIKFNAGLVVHYGRFGAYGNIRHQITSSNNGPIIVAGITEQVDFDNRASTIQFGITWDIIRF